MVKLLKIPGRKSTGCHGDQVTQDGAVRLSHSVLHFISFPEKEKVVVTGRKSGQPQICFKNVLCKMFFPVIL